MTERYIVQTQNLSKAFKQSMIVYRLSMKIPEGTIAGLLGPNGAGKSTTIKMLTGRLKPTSGSAFVFDHNPWQQRSELMKKIGYLPERPAYYPTMTAIRFLTYMARLYGYPRQEALRRARNSLHLAGIGRFEANIVGKMSSGQKQRLGFAAAILHDPQFIILDEPTANLDPQGRIYIMDLIGDLAREGKTILVSSHILSEIERVCSWVAIMTDGHILAAGHIRDLVHDVFDTEYIIQSNNSTPLKEALSDTPYFKKIEQDNDFLYVTLKQKQDFPTLWTLIPKLAHENNIQLKLFKPAKDALEKLFVDLVGEENEME